MKYQHNLVVIPDGDYVRGTTLHLELDCSENSKNSNPSSDA
jgi:hypothetical protein